MKIVICDDEKSYAEILEHKIKKTLDELKIEHSITTYNSLNDIEGKLDGFDLVFLDIMINDCNSIEWLYEQSFNRTQVIIMTAFPLEAYNLSEVDCCYYLIKPKLTDEQLLKAIKRAIANLTKELPNVKLISYGNTHHAIDINNILYIESFNNNIVIHLTNGKQITLYSTLKDIEKELESNFLHCHKSYIVNMNHISSYLPYKFCLSNNDEIPIPRKKYAEMINKYKTYAINF